MKKKFAVFLDRDGTINKEVGNLYKIEDLEILPRVKDAIILLNKYKIPIIVITNQAVIARGWISEEGVKKINIEIKKRLETQGARLHHFYFCPHHPNANLEKYRMICECRKPNMGLIKKAVKRFKVDLGSSYVIGDTFWDIELGKNAGCTTIGVKSGSSDFRESKPDLLVEDLYEAVSWILTKEGFI